MPRAPRKRHRHRSPKDAIRVSDARAPLQAQKDAAVELSEISGKLKEGGLSRGQRKRLRQRESKWAKMHLVDMIEAKRRERERKKKSGKLIMDTLSTSLSELVEQTDSAKQSNKSGNNSGKQRSRKTMSNKARKRVVIEEVDLHARVLDHAAFKSNPLAAIRAHLTNTVVAAAKIDATAEDTVNGKQ